MLPNKLRGVPRVDDRRVLNGIMWVLRSGAPWRDLPDRYGPYTTCYNRFNRWRKNGVWDRLMDAIVEAHDGDIRMIDSSSVRVHRYLHDLYENRPPMLKAGDRVRWILNCAGRGLINGEYAEVLSIGRANVRIKDPGRAGDRQ